MNTNAIKVRAEQNIESVSTFQFSHTCPHCHNSAFFTSPSFLDDLKISNDYENYILGQRFCPCCKGHVFVVFRGGSLCRSYPSMTIDFDVTDIPENISDTFKEALECHASGCQIAAAIMVRKTLEEICADRGAIGNNLKERILSLKTKIVLPQELLDALDELRFLGNDAAHIELKDFKEIGVKELETAIEFTKEILKALFQYKRLLSTLRSLKKDSAKKEDLKEIPKKS